MPDLTAQRTLVKSPPELWSELSEVESLAKHLGELGEIRITKVEPETTVAWEGEEISGTVELEQSGWGTRVTFRATVPEPDRPQAPEPVVAEPRVVASEPDPPSEPDLVSEPAVEARRERGGFLARWLFRQRRPVERAAVTVVREPEPEPEPEPDEPVVSPAELDEQAERVQAILDGTLEALGQAHHRPFSRG
jgi:hypothetical protein